MNAFVPARASAFTTEAGTVSFFRHCVRHEMRTVEDSEIAAISGCESGAGYANPGTYTLDPGKYGDNNLAETVIGFVNGFVKGFTSGL